MGRNQDRRRSTMPLITIKTETFAIQSVQNITTYCSSGLQEVWHESCLQVQMVPTLFAASLLPECSHLGSGEAVQVVLDPLQLRQGLHEGDDAEA